MFGNSHLLVDFIMSVARISLPLALAALAGFWSEKSGVPQVGLEGFLLLGALTGATFADLFHALAPAFILTLVVGAFSGMFFFLLSETLELNAILVGLVFNLLVAGVAPYVTKLLFGSTGPTPFLPPQLQWHIFPFLWLGIIFFGGLFVFNKTGFGVLVRFAGEKPAAIASSGYSLSRVRLVCLALCGAIAASGGCFLSTYLASNYSPMMSAGRGFIALAALIFARWRWTETLLIAVLFGFFDAAQIFLQGFNSPFPIQFFQAIPYVATLLVLLFHWSNPERI